MKNFLIAFVAFVLSVNSGYAQDVIDIGQDIGKTASQIKKAKEDDGLFGKKGKDAGELSLPDAQGGEKKEKGFFAKIGDYFFGDDDSDELKKENAETQEQYIARMEKLAEEGDLKTQKALAYVYLYGKNGFPLNKQKAFTYYEMAAEQGDSTALNNLGSLYFNGIGVQVNYQKAIELFEEAAKAGSSEAALNLGFIYLSGRNAVSNAAHAVEKFSMAAEKGSVVAKFMLGYANYRGFGTKQDLKLASKLIKEAADEDFDEAQYVIGYMYLHGIGIVKNYDNAEKYLTYAMKQGNMSAMMELANNLAAGPILLPKPEVAYIIYSVAAVMGEKSAGALRDEVEPKIKREVLPQVQATAENFEPKPSEITEYARKTFGENIRGYIDENVSQK